MKYLVLKWKICGHSVWEVVHLDEKLWRAYGPNYLKPLEKPSFIQRTTNQIKNFTNIKNKALKPKKKGKK